MKRLLNTLYIMSEDVYLTLDGENVVAKRGEKITARYPLHTLQSIIDFSYMGASPALLGKCADMGVAFTFCSPRGRFLARVTGEANGNVLLRRKQYRVADDEENSCLIAKNMIFGKLYNSKQSIERTRRDHALRVDCEALTSVSQLTAGLLPLVQKETRLDGLRGLEGVAANAYFSIFNELILNSKELFRFTVRSRRPRMRCCRLRIQRLPLIVHLRLKALDWIRTSDFCIVTGRAELHWHLISWKNCVRVWQTDLSLRASITECLTETISIFVKAGLYCLRMIHGGVSIEHGRNAKKMN